MSDTKQVVGEEIFDSTKQYSQDEWSPAWVEMMQNIERQWGPFLILLKKEKTPEELKKEMLEDIQDRLGRCNCEGCTRLKNLVTCILDME